jgi:hypothetical protein
MVAVSQTNIDSTIGDSVRYGIIIATNSFPFTLVSSKYVICPQQGYIEMKGLHISSTDVLISLTILGGSPAS